MENKNLDLEMLTKDLDFIVIQGSGNNRVILNKGEEVRLVNSCNCNGMTLTKEDISMLKREINQLGDAPYIAEGFLKNDSKHLSVRIKGQGGYQTIMDSKYVRIYLEKNN